MLTVSNLTKSYQAPGGIVKALDDISFSIDKGQFVSIIGKSGSGKSTLLSMLGALDGPTSGSIDVDGTNIAKLSKARQTSYRAKQIGFVFQQYNLIPNLSALENVMLALEFGGFPNADRKARAEELLESVGIEADQQLRRPQRLSGGQQQRVAIARALANQPAYILADEPTGNLDSENGKKIFELLHKLSRSEKTTIIVVTHDLEIAGKTDKTFTLKDGKITTKT
jgi:putative ABC transport system ATP-binding protein